MTENPLHPPKSFKWDVYERYQFLIYVFFIAIIINSIYCIWDGYSMNEPLVIGIHLIALVLWFYALHRYMHGYYFNVILTSETITFWQTPNKPIVPIIKTKRVIVQKSDIKELYIPLGRDRVIIRLKNGRRKFIELDNCKDSGTKIQLLEAIEYYCSDCFTSNN